MRSQRGRLISHSLRGLHQGQRSATALKGRTYDRTVPGGCNVEKSALPAGLFHICPRGCSTYVTLYTCGFWH